MKGTKGCGGSMDLKTERIGCVAALCRVLGLG